MKTTITLIFAGILFGCTQEREIQMSMTSVQLVKIDTIQRYPDITEQLLTWLSEDNVSYVTYEPMHKHYALGSRINVMVKR